MKKIILSAVVAAAAIFGGFTANQTSSELASMGLMDATDVEAEAKTTETWAYFGPEGSGKLSPDTPSTYKETVELSVGADAGGGTWSWFGLKGSAKKTKERTITTTYFYCDNDHSHPNCHPYILTITQEED